MCLRYCSHLSGKEEMVDRSDLKKEELRKR